MVKHQPTFGSLLPARPTLIAHPQAARPHSDGDPYDALEVRWTARKDGHRLLLDLVVVNTGTEMLDFAVQIEGRPAPSVTVRGANGRPLSSADPRPVATRDDERRWSRSGPLVRALPTYGHVAPGAARPIGTYAFLWPSVDTGVVIETSITTPRPTAQVRTTHLFLPAHAAHSGARDTASDTATQPARQAIAPRAPYEAHLRAWRARGVLWLDVHVTNRSDRTINLLLQRGARAMIAVDVESEGYLYPAALDGPRLPVPVRTGAAAPATRFAPVRPGETVRLGTYSYAGPLPDHGAYNVQLTVREGRNQHETVHHVQVGLGLTARLGLVPTSRAARLVEGAWRWLASWGDVLRYGDASARSSSATA